MPTTEAEVGARRLVIAPGGHAIAGKATRGRVRAGAEAAHGMVARTARRRSVATRCGWRCQPQSGPQRRFHTLMRRCPIGSASRCIRRTWCCTTTQTDGRRCYGHHTCVHPAQNAPSDQPALAAMGHSVPRVVARRRQAAPSRARAAVAHRDGAKVRVAARGARAQLALRRDAAQRDALPLPRHQLLVCQAGRRAVCRLAPRHVVGSRLSRNDEPEKKASRVVRLAPVVGRSQPAAHDLQSAIRLGSVLPRINARRARPRVE